MHVLTNIRTPVFRWSTTSLFLLVDTVKEIVYKSKEGPSNKEELPAYSIADFSATTIPSEDAVPIPVVTDRCEETVVL